MSRFLIQGGALALAFSLFALSAPSYAFDIKKGALVLRSGNANTNASYNNEDTDSNDKLRGVSALCSPDNSNKSASAALINTDQAADGLFQGNFGATQASTILNLGGTLVSKPITDNPNHCEISGLTVSQIKGVWTMCNAGNNPQCP